MYGRWNPSRPGRPAGGRAGHARERLLDAAQALFVARGYDGVTARMIAQEAGTNPALIHYHFGDKQGLYEAMLQRLLEPVLEQLGRLAEQGTPGRLSDLPEVLRLYLRNLAANPWIPQLVMREVLLDGGRFRERFLALAARRGAPALIGLLRKAQDNGELRPDLDPKLAAQSLLSLCIFPYLAFAITSEAFGTQRDPAFVDALLRHNLNLFLQGAGVRGDDKR